MEKVMLTFSVMCLANVILQSVAVNPPASPHLKVPNLDDLFNQPGPALFENVKVGTTAPSTETNNIPKENTPDLPSPKDNSTTRLELGSKPKDSPTFDPDSILPDINIDLEVPNQHERDGDYQGLGSQTLDQDNKDADLARIPVSSLAKNKGDDEGHAKIKDSYEKDSTIDSTTTVPDVTTSEDDGDEDDKDADDDSWFNNYEDDSDEDDYLQRDENADKADETGLLGVNDDDDNDDDDYKITKWKTGNNDADSEGDWGEEDLAETESDFVEDVVDEELAKKNKQPTAPTSMVLFYTWMIVIVLIVVVGVSTYQSHCKGKLFGRRHSASGEDRKRLLEHEFV